MFKMSNDQKIHCQKIDENQEIDLCAKLSIKMLNIVDNYIILKEKFHIMKNLSCSLIVEINILKSYDVSSK